MNAAARMIDANLNRAREALRALEDLARFARDDSEASAKLKALRHDLSDAFSRSNADSGLRLAWRDTEGDVGTQISAPGEYTRTSIRDMAEANSARLGESLRSIEESAKLASDHALAAAIEAIRYRSYDTTGAFVRSLGTGRRCQYALCVLLTDQLCGELGWRRVAIAAMDGGADCLQLREKTLSPRELLDRARELVSLARPRNVAVFVNDSTETAMLSGADGVHLGQTDLSPRDARRICGNQLLIGVSTESLEQAHAAADSGADLCGVGPMFPTTTKHKARLAGGEYLRAYTSDQRMRHVPHLAIGGITPQNAGTLAPCGLRGMAVSGAVCSAADPASACRALLASANLLRAAD